MHAGTPAEGGTVAVLGPGTGLGECFSTATEVGKEYDTYASEGGHAEFAPRNDLETELLTFLTSADVSIKEELVLKIAILAERFNPDHEARRFPPLPP